MSGLICIGEHKRVDLSTCLILDICTFNKQSVSQGDQNSGFRGVCHFVGFFKNENTYWTNRYIILFVRIIQFV